MKILTIDFETYYSQEFSLTKLTTEEYIRHSEFQVVGVSVQVDDGEPVWFSGSEDATRLWLRQFLWDSSFALAHNAMFDAAILSWVFDIKPKRWLDTLSMARALHGTEVGGSLGVLAQHYNIGKKGDEVANAKGLRRIDFTNAQLARYGEYCCNDTALTYQLFRLMGDGFPVVELRLIDLTIRMFSEPRLELDKELLSSHLEELKKKRKKLLEGYDEGSLMSNPKFAEVLLSHGVIPPTKISPTTGKVTYAFAKADHEFRDLLEHPNHDVQTLVAARLGAKSTIEQTRTERFLGTAWRGTFPVPLRYYAAHTGRWGGTDFCNIQNIPKKSTLRDAILAPKGHVILDADSSQIEVRCLAWLAGQDDLVEVFEKNNAEIAAGVPKNEYKYDPYRIMASKIYNKSTKDVTDADRWIGKTVLLGSGYGLGPTKFRMALKTAGVDVNITQAEHIINTYRESYPYIVRLWRATQGILPAILGDHSTTVGRDELLKVEGNRGILLPNGLYLKYPNLRWVDNPETNKTEFLYDTKRGKQVVPTRIYGPKGVENITQALARIIIGEQMLLVDKKYPVVMTVHDAIACVVRKDETEEAKQYIESCMRTRPVWAPDLPLNCESGYGERYGDC